MVGPLITKLMHLDVYRDGGSVSASFQGDDDKQYCLLLRIRPEAFHESIKTYRAPMLEAATLSQYTSPVTGVSSPEWVRESREVSWNDAGAILEKLRPFMDGFQTECAWVFVEMLRAVATETRAPHSS